MYNRPAASSYLYLQPIAILWASVQMTSFLTYNYDLRTGRRGNFFPPIKPIPTTHNTLNRPMTISVVAYVQGYITIKTIYISVYIYKYVCIVCTWPTFLTSVHVGIVRYIYILYIRIYRLIGYINLFSVSSWPNHRYCLFLYRIYLNLRVLR